MIDKKTVLIILQRLYGRVNLIKVFLSMKDTEKALEAANKLGGILVMLMAGVGNDMPLPYYKHKNGEDMQYEVQDYQHVLLDGHLYKIDPSCAPDDANAPFTRIDSGTISIFGCVFRLVDDRETVGFIRGDATIPETVMGIVEDAVRVMASHWTGDVRRLIISFLLETIESELGEETIPIVLDVVNSRFKNGEW